MTSHNKEIARRFLLATSPSDTTTLRAVLAPEAHLSLMIAGIYSPRLRAFPQGTQWDREGMIRMFTNFQLQLEGPFALRILSMTAEGDAVAAEVIGTGRRAANGRAYIQHYSYHLRIVNGRIGEIRLYQDTFHLWDVWSDASSGERPHYQKAGKLSEAAPAGKAAQAVLDGTPAQLLAANKSAVRRFLTAVRARDPEATREAWSPNGRWSFAIGGDYSPGLRAFEDAPCWDPEAMINMHRSQNSRFKEPLTLDIYSLIAEGDAISAEAVGFVVREDGRSYRQHYGFHFLARHGKLIEGHVYQDTLHQHDVVANAGETPVAPPAFLARAD